MADSLEKQIREICEEWSAKVATDMNISLAKALKDSGTSNPQATLTFANTVSVVGGAAKIQILASGDYWDYIDKGVDGTKVKHGSPYAYKKKAVDFDAIEKWIKASSINAKKILLDIEIKRKGLSIRKGGLSKTRKELSGKKGHNDAVGRLSKVFAVAIARDGHEPKPFVNRVLHKERLELLTNRLSTVMGQTIIASLQFGEGKNEIKLTV